MGPTPVMLWGGSPTAGRTLTRPSPPLSARYWPPPPPVGYWLPLPPSGHPSQSSSTRPPPSGQGYWLPPWTPLAGGQAPPCGMPLWTTPTPQPQPQQPSTSPPMVSHLCLLSVVTFIIQANVERLACSSIYVFKHPSSSAGRDFAITVLNMGGSDEGSGTNNDMTP
jgi:hypothetical protein